MAQPVNARMSSSSEHSTSYMLSPAIISNSCGMETVRSDNNFIATSLLSASSTSCLVSVRICAGRGDGGPRVRAGAAAAVASRLANHDCALPFIGGREALFHGVRPPGDALDGAGQPRTRHPGGLRTTRGQGRRRA